jgi:hypothetical protein
MLRYRYSSLSGTPGHDRRFPEDTLRIILFGIMLTKINCNLKKRNYFMNGHLPDSMSSYLPYEEYVEEPDMMIIALDSLREWILKKQMSMDAESLVITLQNVIIVVEDNEVVVRTNSDSLRGHIKNDVEKEGKRFRTVRV